MSLKYVDLEGNNISYVANPERCELISSAVARLDGILSPYAITVNSEEMQVWWKGQVYSLTLPSTNRRKSKGAGAKEGGRDLVSQMPGTLLKILVAEGDEVNLRQPLVLMESMKMEMTLESPGQGKVSKIFFQTGDKVDRGALLLQLEAPQ